MGHKLESWLRQRVELEIKDAPLEWGAIPGALVGVLTNVSDSGVVLTHLPDYEVDMFDVAVETFFAWEKILCVRRLLSELEEDVARVDLGLELASRPRFSLTDEAFFEAVTLAGKEGVELSNKSEALLWVIKNADKFK